MSLLATVNLPASPYPPLAVGFMGLGTGYLIYGTQELFGYPKRDAVVDHRPGVRLRGRDLRLARARPPRRAAGAGGTRARLLPPRHRPVADLHDVRGGP